MTVSVVRSQCQCLSISVYGLLESVLRLQDITEVVVQFGVTRFELQCGAETCLGGSIVVLYIQKLPEIDVCLPVAGLQARGFAECRDGAGTVAEGETGVAKIEM